MADNPKFLDSIATKAQPYLQKMADVTGGEETLRQQQYLVKFPGESSTHPTPSESPYMLRLNQAEYNNTVNETIALATSKLFRKPIQFSDNTPKELLVWAEDVDGNGTTLNEWAKQTSQDAIRDGLVYSFVDVPNIEGIESMSDADKAQYDLSPKLSKVNFIDVLNRRYDNKGKLQQVTLSESVTRTKGQFEEETVKQYRVMYIDGAEVYQDIYEEAKEGEEPILKSQGIIITPSDGRGKKLLEIPMASYYTNKIGHHNAKPPLLEQANTLISWFNVNSQYKRALQDCADPTLIIKGRQPNEEGKLPDISVGTKKVIDVMGDGDAKWLELMGQSLPEFRERLAKQQEELDSYKTSIQEKDASISVKQIGIENSDKVSMLTSWSTSGSVWLTNIMYQVAAYMGIQYDGTVTMNTDFDSFTLEPDRMEKLSQFVIRGQLSNETFLTTLKNGEVMPPDFDVAKELGKLNSQNPTQ